MTEGFWDSFLAMVASHLESTKKATKGGKPSDDFGPAKKRGIYVPRKEGRACLKRGKKGGGLKRWKKWKREGKEGRKEIEGGKGGWSRGRRSGEGSEGSDVLMLRGGHERLPTRVWRKGF